jgi:hypothetical protein
MDLIVIGLLSAFLVLLLIPVHAARPGIYCRSLGDNAHAQLLITLFALSVALSSSSASIIAAKFGIVPLRSDLNRVDTGKYAIA